MIERSWAAINYSTPYEIYYGFSGRAVKGHDLPEGFLKLTLSVPLRISCPFSAAFVLLTLSFQKFDELVFHTVKNNFKSQIFL